VNWKNLFISGLVLGLSPLSMRVDHTLFLYALFGYGLCAFSYSFKRLSSYWDYLIIGDLALVLAAGILNYFSLYLFFQYLFLTLLFADFSETIRYASMHYISIMMLFLTGTLITLYFGGLFGQKGLTNLAVFLFYFLYFMAGAVIVIGYRKPD